ncbi:PREDICTED: C-type lectin domain family 2 member B-like [Leptosomus discolor]|uniref:C-type lectin domain family 2 member B-like n=1 Tax=Leptosomus discolor TaxID=188344 RepID=UPI0005224985|nr:PREDICTED: C-type lectin domain family 2 member B-like [Leptosomus discolor]
MESEDEPDTETTWMAQARVGTIESTNVQQDGRQEVAASSWVWKTRRCCKEWFLQSKALKHETSHHGKFPSEQCPSEWIGYKNKCYFISEEEKNWTSSQIFCTKNESLLVIFENQEEMHSLAKRLQIEDSWIGLHKKGESFYWENGVALKVDSFQIRNHSECAYLDDFTISTSACSLPRRWICVRPPKTMT